MKSLKCKLCFLFAFMAISLTVLAQKTNENKNIDTQKPAIVLMARTQNNTIQLRWLPLDAALWRTANRNGWQLERMELSEAGSKIGFRPLSKNAFKPLSDREWITQTDTTNKYVSIARQAIWHGVAYPSDRKFEAIQAYQNEENALFSYFLLSTSLSDQAAKGAALGFDDATAERGKAYMYRAYVVGAKTDTALAIIRDWATPSVKQVQNVRTEEGEGNVTLYWQTANNDQNFIAYDIERSADGGKNFKSINRYPFFLSSVSAPELRYVDSVKNYTPYQYRIVGYTYFGDKGKPSKNIVAMGRDRSPAVGATQIKAEGTPQKVTITWQLPVVSADLAGFYVGRSVDAEGGFKHLNTQLLPPTTRQFVDNQPQVLEPFYIVHAVDTAGNISPAYAAMASVLDTIAPSKPTVLRGICDSNGIVTLTWQAAKEADIQGYYVYRANNLNDVYLPLSKSPANELIFTDTVSMKALNRAIYYKITAVDFNYNASPYSDILVVMRPDVIPPAPPVFTQYEVVHDSVKLTWQNSPSSDVAKYRLKSRELTTETRQNPPLTNNSATDNPNTEGSSQSNFKAIATFTPAKAVRQFTDVNVQNGREYVLEVQDSAGNVSVSKPLRVNVRLSFAAKNIENFRIETDKQTGEAKLTWQYIAATTDPRCRFVIYRSRVGMALETYESVAGKTPQYADTLPTKGAWQYAVKAIHADGSESDLSAVVVVKN